MPALPERVLGCYWTYWNGPALTSLPGLYNTVYFFSALPAGQPGGSTGAVTWSQSRPTSDFNTGLAALRAAGRCVILSIGGANAYLRLDTTERADAFIASIGQIHQQLGGFDGIDLDIEGGQLWPDHLATLPGRSRTRSAPISPSPCPRAHGTPWRSRPATPCVTRAFSTS